MTLREAISEASARIARRDAETLLLHVLRQHIADADRAWLLAHSDEPLREEDLTKLHALTARRAAQEPLQHLTGEQEFYGLALRVTPDTLIPRPETEHLVEAVLLWATQFHDERTLRIVDVGTGTGAIAIALATHLAGAEFLALDTSAAALAVAEENARAHGCGERIRFLRSDLLAALSPDEAGGPIDAIVSNPPYVALNEAAALQPEVAGFEPHAALFAGDDGLAVYRRLIPQAHAALRPGGLLALEFGFGQREALHSLLTLPPNCWEKVRFLDDYAGIPRVALAERA